MKPLYSIIILAIALSGCGRDCRTIATGATVSSPGSSSSNLERVIDDENAYRLGQGQTKLTKGLSCSVVQVASGNWLSTSSPGYPGSGVIVTTGSSYSYLLSSAINEPSSTGVETLIPTALQATFLSLNYKISCSGYLAVEADDYYNFSSDSDDGSIITVAGTQVINNDGNHGMTKKTGFKFLRRGVHSFSVLYAQTGSGPHGLIVLMNNSDLNPAALLH